MKKGFTLIELLAVIVILAIIALIATPMILGVIETARKGAAKTSALGYLDAVEKQIMINQLDSDITNDIKDGNYNLPMNNISVKGTLPTEGFISIEDGLITDYEMTIMDYNVTIENGKIIVSKEEPEEIIEAESVTITGSNELIGRSIQLTSTILPENTTDKTVTWKSSNEEIATVSSNGLVSGKGNGTVTITATTSNGKEFTKEIVIKMPVCIRALELHTDECAQQNEESYCSGAGYIDNSEKGTTIKYGKLGEKGQPLTNGDALDCDVDGSKTYDEDERFYYLGELENNSDYAVLIYYNNVSKDNNGIVHADNTSNSSIAYYSTANENWHGPVTAITNLPTTSDWINVSLSNTNRTIINEEGTTVTNKGSNIITNPFSYEGYSARLLTYKEVITACGREMDQGSTFGYLDDCDYLLESTHYSSSTINSTGYWLENPVHTLISIPNLAWSIYASTRRIDGNLVNNANLGVRPVIEVLKTEISN